MDPPIHKWIIEMNYKRRLIPFRGGDLPPGLEKKLQPFPVELERSLPPIREGLIRGIIGGSAVIMNRNFSIILDVFKIF